MVRVLTLVSYFKSRWVLKSYLAIYTDILTGTVAILYSSRYHEFIQ